MRHNWKRWFGIMVTLALVLGLVPGMSVMAIADGPHLIHNEISAIIPGLSITKNGKTVTDASSGDTITLTISDQPVTGKIGTLFQSTDRDSFESRNIMVDGLQAYNADGTTIETKSTGSQTWSFTMPDGDVHVAFLPLTAGKAIPINAGEAAFRTGFATLDSYCFYTYTTNSSDDSFGYLAYKDSSGEYKYTSNDDSGDGYNFKIPGDSGATSLAIMGSTFYHLGFTEYHDNKSGTFTIPTISKSMKIPFSTQTVTPQTVTAEDIEMSFGEICKIAATTNGDGTLSYKVENGDDVIDVNYSTGAITTKKTGTATVKITASGTTTYAVGSRSITVTVNKARAIAATVNENSRTYDGSAQPLVTAGSVEGGTMEYALGTDDVTPPTNGWSTDIPTATEAGTYYVWYRIIGDANHNDVDPACVVVTIGEAAAPATTTVAAPVAPVAPAPTTDYTLLATLKTSGKKALKMRWTAVPGAEGYDVFFGMCNKGDCQLLASVNGTSYKIKGLKKGFAYKGYVWAWKNIGGAKTYIGEPSPDVHAITNGKSNHYTNPKKISVKKKKLTVGVGKRKAIKAKLKKFSNSRNYLNHVSAKIRYYSSDRTVATVDAKGRVTGVGPGKCTVFAVAENGLRVGVKVTVK